MQIVLESFCVYSPAHASFYLFYGGPSCLLSLCFLKSSFLHCGVYPFLFMLPLRFPFLSPTLTLSLPHDLVLWTDGSVPFPLGKGSSGVFANCSLFMTLRPLFPFQLAQYVQAFPLKPMPFCKLFPGLGSTNKPATSLIFSFYLSSPLFTLLSLSFYLKLCGRSGRNCLLFPVPSDYNGSPETSFSWGTTRLISRLNGERYLRPLQSLVVSLVLFLVSTLLFSRTGGVLFHRSSSTRKFP